MVRRRYLRVGKYINSAIQKMSVFSFNASGHGDVGIYPYGLSYLEQNIDHRWQRQLQSGISGSGFR